MLTQNTKTFILAILAVFFYSVTYGQNNTRYYFHNLRTIDGLSQNSVSHIMQDGQGMVWLATQVGVDKCIGNTISYVSGLDKSLTEGITLLFDWDETHILVATDKQNYWVHKWDPGSVEPVNSTINSIQSVTRIGRDSLLLFTDSTILLTNSKIQQLTRPSVFLPSGINDVLPDGHDNWYLATEKGLFRYTRTTNKLVLLRNDYKIKTLCYNKDSSSLFLGVNASIIPEYSISANILQVHHCHTTVSDNPATTTLYLEDDSLLWIGTKNAGLWLYNLHTDQCHPIYLSLNPEIKKIYPSRDGVVWVGTGLGGVSIIQRDRQVFKHQFNGRLTPPPGLSQVAKRDNYKNNVWSILPLKKDTILLGTNGNGFAVFNFVQDSIMTWVTIYPKYKTSRNQHVKCLVPFGSEIIAGTEGGLFKWSPTSHKAYYKAIHYKNTPILWDSSVSILQVDASSKYLLAGDKKRSFLQVYDEKFRKCATIELPKTGENLSFLYNIYRPHNYYTLVGTTSSLYRIRTNDWHLVEVARLHEKIHSICAYQENNSDTIWVGSDRKGLFCYKMDTTLHLLKIFDKSNGLPIEVIYAIQADRQHHLWFSTNHGIYGYRPGTGFNKYENKDDWEIPEFNAGSFANLQDSLLFFGGINGLTSFVPVPHQQKNIYSPVLKYVYSSHDPQYIDFNNPQNIRDARIQVPYKFGHLELSPMLGYYQDPDNTQFRFILSGDTLKKKNNEDYMIFENQVKNRLYFSSTNTLIIEYRTANGKWQTLPVIRIYRSFFTGINILVIPFFIAVAALCYLGLRYYRSSRKWLTIQKKINEISRTGNIPDLCAGSIAHFIGDFEFDYAIIWLIDFDAKIIYNADGDSVRKKKINPKEWKQEFKYSLHKNNILAQVSRLEEKIIVINNRPPRNPYIKNTPDLFDGALTKLANHDRTTRVYIPVIHRTSGRDGTGKTISFLSRTQDDIVMGVMELGFVQKRLITLLGSILYWIQKMIPGRMGIFKPLKYFEQEKIRLQLYIDNFSQPYLDAYVKEQTRALNKWLRELEALGNQTHIDPEGFLKLCLDATTKRLGVEYASVSLTSYNSASIDLAKGRLFSGFTQKQAEDGYNQYVDINKIRTGIVNYVALTKKPYNAPDVDKDEKYIKIYSDGKSELSLPMIFHSGSPVYGVISLISTRPNYFNKIIESTYADIVKRITEIYIQKKQYRAMMDITSTSDSFTHAETDIYARAVNSLQEYFESNYISVWVRDSYDNTAFTLSTATIPTFYEIYKNFDFTSFVLGRDRTGEQLATIAMVEDISDKDSRIYRFCKQPQLDFRSYICLLVVIDHRFHSFINIFSRNVIERDTLAGYSRAFLEEISKKIALATQRNQLSKSMELISTYLVKAEQSNPKKQIVNEAYHLLPSADSVVLFPYKEGQTILLRHAVVGGQIPPEDLTQQDRPANMANHIINIGTVWVETEAHYRELSRAALPDNPERESFWEKKKLRSVAALRLENENGPVGVMFFNYKIQKNFQDEGYKQFITAFTDFVKIALVNENYIRTIESKSQQLNTTIEKLNTSNEQLTAAHEKLSQRHDFVLKENEQHKSTHLEDLKLMEDMLPVANAAAVIEIVRVVNHDIRNHLVKMALTMKSRDNPKIIQDMAAIIQNDIDNASTLIELFEPESFEITTDEELDDMVEHVASLFRRRMQRRGGTGIVVDTSQLNAPKTIRCSKAVLSMIIYNLVSNAYTAIIDLWQKRDRRDKKGKRSDYPEGTIIISTDFKQGENYYYLTVKDDGIGISNELQNKIFDLRYSTREGGTGIGLYFVKNTIERVFGGTIKCTSYVDLGTTFTLKFRQYNK